MSNKARNICILCFIIVFYSSYWVWRLSDFYTSPFYSEETSIESTKLEKITKIIPINHSRSEPNELIENLMKKDDDNIVNQKEWIKNFELLVELDYLAIPAILNRLKITLDLDTQIVLLRALQEIGDPLVRKDLEELLHIYDNKSASKVLTTLVHLKCTESIPTLENLLKNSVENKLKPSLEDTIWNLRNISTENGDYSEVLKLLPINFSETNNYTRFIEIFSKYPPIQNALKCHDNMFIISDREKLFLMAVDEWYFENVLMKPSPYKVSPEFKFKEPFSEEKLKGWNLLCAENNISDKFNILRVLPMDKNLTDSDVTKELTVIMGNGHGGTLNIYHFKPNETNVVVQSFLYGSGQRQLNNNENIKATVYKNSILNLREYQSMLAALHSIFSASIFNWWNENNVIGSRWSSNDFVISITGLENETTFEYCGYPSSRNRINYLKLQAAKNLVIEYIDNSLDSLGQEPDIAFFPKFLTRTKQKCQKNFFRWDCERILSIIKDYGDISILPTLTNILKEFESTNNITNERLIIKVLDIIAKITNQDFGPLPNETPKPLKVVIKEYLELVVSLPNE